MWAAAAVALVHAASALGAVERMPDEVRSAATLSAEQKQQVQRFVSEQMGRLRDGDGLAVEEARQSLVSAFQGSEPSIGFRLEFGRAAANDLKRLATSGDLQRAINAAVVAGAIGTSETIDAIGSGLGDKRAAVRVASATGLREVIVTSAGSRVRKDQGSEAIRRAGGALAKESSPAAALSLVAALESARGSQFHGEAALAVGSAMGGLAAGLPAPAVGDGLLGAEAMQRGVSLMFTRLIDTQGGQVDAAFLRSVVGAGTHALGYAVRHAEQTMGSEREEAIAALGQMVAAAEQAVVYGEARLRNASPSSSTVKASFDASVAAGDASGFDEAARALIARAAAALGSKPSDFGV